MGEQQAVSSTFPLPPMQYIANYSDEKVRNSAVPKPPLPAQDSYNMFGATFTSNDEIIRPLEAQGLTRLHPKYFRHKEELKKLNHSILVNFLELLEVLISCPGGGKREEKVEDINLLFVHMHHLINEYRPHQARETLRVMMEVQKRQRLQTAERFQKHLEKVTEILQGCFSSLPENVEHIDNILAVKLESNQEEEITNTTEKKEVSSIQKDRLMCNLVDSL
ncbi:putative mediator of RNA polymerase II transcription subunit 7-like [Apostichopus japonicus]|uniref:Mediator of RNA polymerase II transcription subunit 7 n=1 Tax=Stichopus japonicus TaxID=307972 RepID=A0A2G8L3U0_STIJA|nr:putative mediator of RNA polymerase II transcription subunit 7-like [Apostichopus japonicus]